MSPGVTQEAQDCLLQPVFDQWIGSVVKSLWSRRPYCSQHYISYMSIDHFSTVDRV